MYIIFLRGVSAPIELEDTGGKIIKEKFKRFKNSRERNDETIDVGGNLFDLSQVKAIIQKDNDRSSVGETGFKQAMYRQQFEKYQNNYNLRKRTPENRAKKMPDWEMCYMSFTGNPPTEKDILVMFEKRRDYFEENPKEVVAPFYLMKEYIRGIKNVILSSDSIKKELPKTGARLNGVSVFESRKLSKMDDEEILNLAKYYWDLLDEVQKKEAKIKHFFS